MKRTIRNLVAFLIVAAAIAVSLLQLRIPVVRAASCPDASQTPWAADGCDVTFLYSTESEGEAGGIHCWYSVRCPVGGGDPMEIEREVYVEN